MNEWGSRRIGRPDGWLAVALTREEQGADPRTSLVLLVLCESERNLGETPPRTRRQQCEQGAATVAGRPTHSAEDPFARLFPATVVRVDFLCPVPAPPGPVIERYEGAHGRPETSGLGCDALTS
jgi:hypothetical protein